MMSTMNQMSFFYDATGYFEIPFMNFETFISLKTLNLHQSHEIIIVKKDGIKMSLKTLDEIPSACS